MNEETIKKMIQGEIHTNKEYADALSYLMNYRDLWRKACEDLALAMSEVAK
jgi:hypothetical protein